MYGNHCPSLPGGYRPTPPHVSRVLFPGAPRTSLADSPSVPAEQPGHVQGINRRASVPHLNAGGGGGDTGSGSRYGEPGTLPRRLADISLGNLESYYASSLNGAERLFSADPFPAPVSGTGYHGYTADLEPGVTPNLVDNMDWGAVNTPSRSTRTVRFALQDEEMACVANDEPEDLQQAYRDGLPQAEASKAGSDAPVSLSYPPAPEEEVPEKETTEEEDSEEEGSGEEEDKEDESLEEEDAEGEADDKDVTQQPAPGLPSPATTAAAPQPVRQFVQQPAEQSFQQFVQQPFQHFVQQPFEQPVQQSGQRPPFSQPHIPDPENHVGRIDLIDNQYAAIAALRPPHVPMADVVTLARNYAEVRASVLNLRAALARNNDGDAYGGALANALDLNPSGQSATPHGWFPQGWVPFGQTPQPAALAPVPGPSTSVSAAPFPAANAAPHAAPPVPVFNAPTFASPAPAPAPVPPPVFAPNHAGLFASSGGASMPDDPFVVVGSNPGLGSKARAARGKAKRSHDQMQGTITMAARDAAFERGLAWTGSPYGPKKANRRGGQDDEEMDWNQ